MAEKGGPSRRAEEVYTGTQTALAELKHALDVSEQEKHIFNALCIDYTAAYLCFPLRRAGAQHRRPGLLFRMDSPFLRYLRHS